MNGWLDVYYLLIFGSTSVILVAFGYRFFKNYKLMSPGQKAILWASIWFSLGSWLGSMQSFLGIDGFRWGFLPITLGIVSMFVYVMEPWDIQKQRWGQPAWWPKDQPRP